tara:strand:+ start:342 stop:644 length:303 start_codon:yes stop_codon:yes gene_type:complete
MTAQFDPLAWLEWKLNNPDEYAAEVAASAAEYAAEKAAREAARVAAEAEKKAAYNADGFFWNNLNRRYDCARCSGRGIIQHYRHVAGGVCFNCDGEGFRL